MSATYPPRWIAACTGLRDRLRVVAPDVVVPTSGDRLAVIVEMRDDAFLEIVVEIFIRQLASRGWRFCLMHGNMNVDLAKRIQATWTGLELVHLDADNFSLQAYNKFLLSSHLFWNILPGSPRTILRFELDTVLISGDVERFCEYDYVGAPWHPRLKWAGPTGRVGNGGLTIRNVDAMKRAIKALYKPGMICNEDGFFSVFCQQLLRFPSVELAREFAVETWPIEDRPLPCGFHKPWSQLSKKAMPRVYKVIESAYNFSSSEPTANKEGTCREEHN